MVENSHVNWWFTLNDTWSRMMGQWLVQSFYEFLCFPFHKIPLSQVSFRRYDRNRGSPRRAVNLVWVNWPWMPLPPPPISCQLAWTLFHSVILTPINILFTISSLWFANGQWLVSVQWKLIVIFGVKVVIDCRETPRKNGQRDKELLEFSFEQEG